MHVLPRIWMAFVAVQLVGCGAKLDDGIAFDNIEESQPITIEDFSELKYTDETGNEVQLSDLMSKEYLVLVVTRGWTGSICLYCASQTSRWARRHAELDKYNAQLVVVFPTETEEDAPKVDELEQKIKGGDIPNQDIPFPILLDIDLSGVDQLGIRDALAKPSTYIVDRQGRVRFAYVGKTVADRPSIDSVLKQLEQLNQQ